MVTDGPGMGTSFGVEAVGQYKNTSYFNEALINTSSGGGERRQEAEATLNALSTI